MQRTWSLPQASGRAAQLVETLAVSPAVAEILVQRGTVRVDDAVDFLRPTLFNLSSPFCFRAMTRAVERLKRAWGAKEKILVYGDYDVDGVTSVALLYKVLADLGFKAVAYIPHRLEEGYGLHREAIARASAAGVSVIVTVDCGITATEEIHYAGELGIDVIVTDHHEPVGILPEAWAILNPKLEEAYPCRDLAGVGVAFKLAQAILQTFRGGGGEAEFERGRNDDLVGGHEQGADGDNEIGLEVERELLDLVALGTIADVVPLVGENRIIVHQGLEQMQESVHIGITALLKECGLANKPLKAGQIAFIVAPKINAAGRMDSARAGLELLITGNEEKAEELARFLSRENQMRQETEKRILAEAVAELEKAPVPHVIVLSSSGWHHGVVGIVASRLVERYYRPVFLIAVEGEEGKGSARGIPGYHVLAELTAQAHLLHKFGGHRQAAGFSLDEKDIALFRAGLNRSAEAFPEDLYQETLMIDGRVALPDLNEGLLHDLEQLAPFGYGNPGPLLAIFSVPVAGLSCVGKEGTHLKLHLGSDGAWEGMAYRQGGRLAELRQIDTADVAFSLELNTFQGQKKLQLVVQDIQAKAPKEERRTFDNNGSHNRITATGVSAAGLDVETERKRAEWLDWRQMDRSTWLEKVGDKPALVWYRSRLHTLAEFVSNGDGEAGSLADEHRELLAKERWELFSDEQRELGIIVGIPWTQGDFLTALTVLTSLGVKQLALAEFYDLTGIKEELGSWERRELVNTYRELQSLAQEHNPFLWRTEVNGGPERLSALQIFEELGFLRCLGGSDPWVIEFLPVQGKLALETSLRYHSAQKRWENVLKLQRVLTQDPLPVLKQTWIGKLSN